MALSMTRRQPSWQTPYRGRCLGGPWAGQYVEADVGAVTDKGLAGSYSHSGVNGSWWAWKPDGAGGETAARTSTEGGLGTWTVHEWPDDPAEGI
jgi:hypothetical protein